VGPGTVSVSGFEYVHVLMSIFKIDSNAITYDDFSIENIVLIANKSTIK
jgi:hypothetical protein